MSTSEKRTILIKIQPDATYVVVSFSLNHKRNLPMLLTTKASSYQFNSIYYDFENGRRKIYTRTLCRLSRLSERDMRLEDLDEEASERLRGAQ